MRYHNIQINIEFPGTETTECLRVDSEQGQLFMSLNKGDTINVGLDTVSLALQGVKPGVYEITSRCLNVSYYRNHSKLDSLYLNIQTKKLK